MKIPQSISNTLLLRFNNYSLLGLLNFFVIQWTWYRLAYYPTDDGLAWFFWKVPPTKEWVHRK